MNANHLIPEPRTAYHAAITRGLLSKSQNIGKELEALLIVSDDDTVILKYAPFLFAVTGNLEQIPAFLHPIIYNNKAYIDARPFVYPNGTIKNYHEVYNLAKRALLDLTWLQDRELFDSEINFIVDAFSSWFANGLQRNLNLTLNKTYTYRIIAAIYYLGLMTNDHIVKDADILLYIIKRLPMMIGVPAQSIDELITADEEMVLRLFRNGFTGAEPAVELLAIALSTINSTDEPILSAVIYNALCRGAFIATNAIEIASIGLEHPPTFIFMMAAVFQNNMQNNTSLGKAVKGIMRKHNIKGFERVLTIITDPIRDRF